MTKKLDVSSITNELQDSVFFPSRVQSATPSTSDSPPPVATDRPSLKRPPHKSPPTHQASVQASELASMLASLHDFIEGIRRIVKLPGKEVSFVRLTPHEKAQLADIVYTYKRQGTKTSENEINRIAVNLLLADYKENGAASVLAKVIAALRA
jgi:hypothetical protein